MGPIARRVLDVEATSGDTILTLNAVGSLGMVELHCMRAL